MKKILNFMKMLCIIYMPIAYAEELPGNFHGKWVNVQSSPWVAAELAKQFCDRDMDGSIKEKYKVYAIEFNSNRQSFDSMYADQDSGFEYVNKTYMPISYTRYSRTHIQGVARTELMATLGEIQRGQSPFDIRMQEETIYFKGRAYQRCR